RVVALGHRCYTQERHAVRLRPQHVDNVGNHLTRELRAVERHQHSNALTTGGGGHLYLLRRASGASLQPSLSSWERTSRNGLLERRRAPSATDPNIQRLNPRRPCVPMTTRSWSASAA